MGSWRETAFAAPLSAKARRGGKALHVCALIRRCAPPPPDRVKASAAVAKFPAQPQSLRACPLPLGGAVAQRLRGYKSAEPEKTVKRSSRRTGVNLQFFPVQPSALGLKGASSPFFVAPARRNRWHFSGSLLVSKENTPGYIPFFPSPVPHGTIHFSAAAVGMRTVYSM